MAKLFKNRYRVEPHRLKGWDYSLNGLYFITICTHEMNHYFGKIHQDLLIPTTAGLIAQIHWYDISTHFEGITLHDFIVMPNHIHGIIQIERIHKSSSSYKNVGGATKKSNPMVNNNSIAAIIRSYKARVTHDIHIHHSDHYFKWHSKYYDIIIRDEQAFENISYYIRTNPLNWHEDRFHH